MDSGGVDPDVLDRGGLAFEENGLVAEAKASLDHALLAAASVTALGDLADRVAM